MTSSNLLLQPDLDGVKREFKKSRSYPRMFSQSEALYVDPPLALLSVWVTWDVVPAANGFVLAGGPESESGRPGRLGAGLLCRTGSTSPPVTCSGCHKALSSWSSRLSSLSYASPALFLYAQSASCDNPVSIPVAPGGFSVLGAMENPPSWVPFLP